MTVHDITIQDRGEMKKHTWIFILWPELWRRFPADRIFNWEMRRLRKAETNNIPELPGIYTLLIQPGIAGHPACSYLVYVGKATSLRKRFENYLTSEKYRKDRPEIVYLLENYLDYIWFCFTLVDPDNLKFVEDTLIKTLQPPCNKRIPAEISSVKGAFT